ncbi:MAG: bifunctional pyr operon transcriptional regulator/uracil phosphoribosyltransferase PyrR [Myxococcales bacterium]|nr:bifunctional pyr operon transcriptional regulator/uracil phosphoribosyltransferase PyrR [Myxococcales bacterium]
MARDEHTVLDAEAIARIVRRVAVEVVERTRGAEHLALVGVRRGGVPIAQRLAEEIGRAEGRQVPVGAVDITLYRDDAAVALPDPKVGPSDIDFDIGGRDLVLVDDVLHTGRTVRAAIDHLLDYGRPRRIWLAVLADRGGRELPVAADFVGRVLEVPEGAILDVFADGGEDDRAVVRTAPPEGGS